MEIILRDIARTVAPSQIPEEDEIFITTVKELTRKMQYRERMLYDFKFFFKSNHGEIPLKV